MITFNNVVIRNSSKIFESKFSGRNCGLSFVASSLMTCSLMRTQQQKTQLTALNKEKTFKETITIALAGFVRCSLLISVIQ